MRASSGFSSGNGGAVCLSKIEKQNSAATHSRMDSGAIQTNRRQGSSRNGDAV
jgi:hypothetical protein